MKLYSLARALFVTSLIFILTISCDVFADTPVLLSDLNPGPADSSPAGGVNIGSKVLFGATGPGSDFELYSTDGTSLGTGLLKNINPTQSSFPILFVPLNGKAIFWATDSDTTDNFEPWISDGTSPGTFQIKDINPLASSFGSQFLVSGPRAYFAADDSFSGNELWSTDGTESGTQLVKDIFPGDSSNPQPMLDLNGILLFVATTRTFGSELWRSDGTLPGTFQVMDINPNTADSNPSDFARLGGVAIFQAFSANNGSELWKSDGNLNNASILEIVPGNQGSSPSQMTTVGSLVMFSAIDASGDQELWRTDGTPNETIRVKDINAGASGSNPSALTEFGGRLIFCAFTPQFGNEPWISDGTEAGTKMLKDVNPGPNSSCLSESQWFQSVGDVAYFPANDSIHGVELWRTDGTEAGTILTTDLAPGSDSSNPIPIATAFGTSVIRATDGIDSLTGTEPYIVDRCEGDPAKLTPGLCGCGVTDIDSDLDGTPNCLEQCSFDVAKLIPGQCGCGIPDVDINGNGVADCLDPGIESVPPKPKFKIKGNKITFTFPFFEGVKYLLKIKKYKKKVRHSSSEIFTVEASAPISRQALGISILSTVNKIAVGRLKPGTYTATYQMIVGASRTRPSFAARFRIGLSQKRR